MRSLCRIIAVYGARLFEFAGQGGVVPGEALFVDEDEGPFVRRRPCTGFFGRIGDVHAAAREKSSQTDGDEFNRFSVFADNEDGDRLTLRHQDIPVLPGNPSKPSPSATTQRSLVT